MHSLAGCFEGGSHDGENIGRFYPGSLGDYFSGDSGLVYDSGTLGPETAQSRDSDPHSRVNGRRPGGLKPCRVGRVSVVWRSHPMPYALFCNEAKLSKAYPTEADVWKLARQSGLVVDVATEQEKPAPRPVLDNDYEIRPCRPDPQEDPARNQADAERDAVLEFLGL